MTSSNPRPPGLSGLFLAAALFPAIASAQAAVRPLEVYGTFGLGQVYLDSSVPDHAEAGGGARLFVTRRFAVQGDLLTLRGIDPYLRSEQRRGVEHTWLSYVSFVGTWGPTNRTVRPYWLVGIAVEAGGKANTAVGLNGGLGARIFVGDRYFLAPEVRGGLGPIFRASISGGIALGAR
jgi:opacity protein-like surface antigen